MTATQPKPRPKNIRKADRPVQQTLLDLAYLMHATRVVKVLPAEPTDRR